MHPLPSDDRYRKGQPAAYPKDPYFMLGNDALNLFIHASGRYSILTGTHGWARLNAGEAPNEGVNAAVLTVSGCRCELVGYDAPFAEREYGAGFARFAYASMDGVVVERVIAHPPGPGANDAAGFLTRVTLCNISDVAVDVRYEESLGVCYVLNTQQRKESKERPVRYQPHKCPDCIFKYFQNAH